MLSISTGTSKWHLSNARVKLQELLKNGTLSAISDAEEANLQKTDFTKNEEANNKQLDIQENRNTSDTEGDLLTQNHDSPSITDPVNNRLKDVNSINQEEDRQFEQKSESNPSVGSILNSH